LRSPEGFPITRLAIPARAAKSPHKRLVESLSGLSILHQERCMKLFAGNSNRVLAEAVARYLNIPLGKASVRRFGNRNTPAGCEPAFSLNGCLRR
jgi:hypothetical protein